MLSGKSLKLIWCRTEGNPTGISYISPKRLGKACIRNRLRRLIRETLAASQLEFPQNLMMAFIARDKLLNLELGQIQSEILFLMSRLPSDSFSHPHSS